MTGEEIAHWAWEAWGRAFDRWRQSLPEDSDLHYADPYPEQYDAFFAAHPDGWPLHPDTPAHVREHLSNQLERGVNANE